MQKKNENALRPWAYLAGFGMVGASSGLFTCISTLLLLSRGLSLSMASLAMSLNFITVLVLEMPSGIAGDLWGRKRVWILSRILSLAGVFCFCFGNIPVVLLGNILFGAGVAFSSGTLDALYFLSRLAMTLCMVLAACRRFVPFIFCIIWPWVGRTTPMRYCCIRVRRMQSAAPS